MQTGPLEYFVIGFQGHKFSGDILPSIKKAADSGAIRVADLVFVTKDASGTVSTLEANHFDNVTAEAFSEFTDNAEGMFSSEDVDRIGETLDNDSSAALVLVEHVWAADLREAIVAAKGRLIHSGYVTQDEPVPA